MVGQIETHRHDVVPGAVPATVFGQGTQHAFGTAAGDIEADQIGAAFQQIERVLVSVMFAFQRRYRLDQFKSGAFSRK